MNRVQVRDVVIADHSMNALPSQGGESAGRQRFRIARSRAEITHIVEAWQRLYSSTRERNPFANPDIQLAWLDNAPNTVQPFVVQAWRDGQLDWIAPMHLAPIGPAGVFGRCLMPFAAHTEDWLIELAPLLSRIDASETVRELVNVALDHRDEWTWIELSLAPEHGWLTTTDDSRFPTMGNCRVMHKGVRAATVLDLAENWDATRAGLKRNIRKSLTKAERKAIDALGGLDFVLASESADVEAFARRLVALNVMRAESEAHVDHSTPFHDERNADLLVDAVCRTVAAKTADVIELRDSAGRTVASQFSPYGSETTFVSHSGFDPAHWACSPMTLLVAKSIQRAIELGHRRVVLSPGPHVSKSRWSTTLECHHTFLVVNGDPIKAARFLTYWVGSAVGRFVSEGRLRRGVTPDKRRFVWSGRRNSKPLAGALAGGSS